MNNTPDFQGNNNTNSIQKLLISKWKRKLASSVGHEELNRNVVKNLLKISEAYVMNKLNQTLITEKKLEVNKHILLEDDLNTTE